MSMDGRTDEQNVAHTFDGLLFGLKKEGHCDICRNVGEPCGLLCIMPSAISQAQKYKYCMVLLI